LYKSWLKQIGVDLTVVDCYGYNIAFSAVAGGQLDVLKWLKSIDIDLSGCLLLLILLGVVGTKKY
jgi:hypothetical protein